MLRWACERTGHNVASLKKAFPRLESWEDGSAFPTLKQLETFAKAVSVPIGYLFLTTPPEEQLPIPDLRTINSIRPLSPSPDMLDVIYLCQRRQTWYHDYVRSTGESDCRFVNSIGIDAPVVQTAETIRKVLNFDIQARNDCPTWVDALRQFIKQAEDVGVLVMVSGVVGINNKRKLDPKEFRGFAIADSFAPLIFINGADTKAGQMFTLAHELAHLWLGESALSDASPISSPSNRIEKWCNQVAAELLVPLEAIKKILPKRTNPLDEVQGLARRFKVSTLVIMRRIYDVGQISREAFQTAYDEEVKMLLRKNAQKTSSGGQFYLTQEVRASRRFVHALVVSTLEGQTLYRDASQLLGIKKEKTFAEFCARIGVTDGISA